MGEIGDGRNRGRTTESLSATNLLGRMFPNSPPAAMTRVATSADLAAADARLCGACDCNGSSADLRPSQTVEGNTTGSNRVGRDSEPVFG